MLSICEHTLNLFKNTHTDKQGIYGVPQKTLEVIL